MWIFFCSVSKKEYSYSKSENPWFTYTGHDNIEPVNNIITSLKKYQSNQGFCY